MGVVGRPRVWSFRAGIVGRFRLRPRLGWMPAHAWQYNSSLEVARIFLMRLRFANIVPMIGRDTYLHGHGRMLGKLLDRIVVVDGSGKEFDTGELTTYLNDAILLAPAMLLGAATSWRAIDDSSFQVSLTDAGRTVTGRVFLDERGAGCCCWRADGSGWSHAAEPDDSGFAALARREPEVDAEQQAGPVVAETTRLTRPLRRGWSPWPGVDRRLAADEEAVDIAPLTCRRPQSSVRSA
jgi:hypothetical protein